MTALLGPTNRMREGNRWGLVAHTVALFSVATISFSINLSSFLVVYMDSRKLPRTDDWPLKPPGYLMIPNFIVVATISHSVIQMNQWLIDGLMVSPMLNSAT